jgi:hypothetical protein
MSSPSPMTRQWRWQPHGGVVQLSPSPQTCFCPLDGGCWEQMRRGVAFLGVHDGSGPRRRTCCHLWRRLGGRSPTSLSFSSGSRGGGAPAALYAGDALQAARWRALCPQSDSSFRPWRRRAPPLPCSSSSASACQCALDREEQRGQMRRCTFPASNEALSGEFLCPLPLFWICFWGLGLLCGGETFDGDFISWSEEIYSLNTLWYHCWCLG